MWRRRLALEREHEDALEGCLEKVQSVGEDVDDCFPGAGLARDAGPLGAPEIQHVRETHGDYVKERRGGGK